MKTIKIILSPVTFIINSLIKGFKILSLFLSKGFYFYLEKFFSLIEKIIPIKLIHKLKITCQKMKTKPSLLVTTIVWFIVILYIFDTLIYTDNTLYTTAAFKDEITPKATIKNNNEPNILTSTETNLYKFYGKYNLDEIDFANLKKANNDIVSWIIVENTNINYPVVQGKDNDYYLTHSFDQSYSSGGWPFLDYRNNGINNDNNTIIYGHNLLNGTAFGSIKKIFKSNKDTKIIILDGNNKYTYQVFSGYEIDPESYYLRTSFNNIEEYSNFLNTLKSRNTLNIDIPISNENIITLSTCTNDNKGRVVIHAKLIETI